MKKLASRKFIVIAVMLAAGIIIDLLTERGLSGQLKELMIYLSGTYIVGNGLSAISDGVKNRIGQKEVDILKQGMVTLDQQQQQLAGVMEKTNEALSKVIRR